MVQFVSPLKALSALIASLSHKHVLGRRIALKTLCDLVSPIVSKISKGKEGDALVVVLAGLVQDQSPETRYLAKKLVLMLCEQDEFDRSVDRLLTGNAQRTMKQVVIRGGRLISLCKFLRIGTSCVC